MEDSMMLRLVLRLSRCPGGLSVGLLESGAMVS